MTDLKISALFAALGDTYDEVRHHMVPCFDDFYGMAAELTVLRLGPSPRILDLGAGTGMLSRVVAGLRPDVRFVLLDGAAELLAQAEQSLGGGCASPPRAPAGFLLHHHLPPRAPRPPPPPPLRPPPRAPGGPPAAHDVRQP